VSLWVREEIQEVSRAERVACSARARECERGGIRERHDSFVLLIAPFAQGRSGKTGFFRKFRESSAWEPKHTVFAFGDFSLRVQRSESHCRDDVSGRNALDEIRRMLSGLRRKVLGDDDQEKA
jgi:hypothetical protein